MARTLSQILTDANAVLDLEATLPTGDELTLRANYADQAVWDAAGSGQFHEFDSEYLVNSSTLATIPLPSNWHEFKHNPRVLDSTGVWQEYPEIDPLEKYEKSNDDRYCYVLGNPSEGYFVIFNGLISMATISMIFQRYPSGMLTLTDVCELSDPTYVTRKIESYVLYSRGDERFPTSEQRADLRLKNMYGRGQKSPGGQSRDTKRKFNNPLS